VNVRKNDPCPCGSGKIAKHCCLQPSGILFKAPTLLALGDPRKQRDGCYLSFAGGCGDKLSREHLMSKGIDARPPNRRRVTAEGVPLNNPYRRADTAKVLCRTHNSMLGPFDTVGARVFSAIGAAIRGQSGKLLIHGYDLERFVLQRIAAHHFAGILTSGGASMAHYHLLKMPSLRSLKTAYLTRSAFGSLPFRLGTTSMTPMHGKWRRFSTARPGS
jgi:hypothetical protein